MTTDTTDTAAAPGTSGAAADRTATASSRTAPLPPHDPRRTEQVGCALARQLGDRGVTAVVCWNNSEDIVLAHVVARELGVGLRLANEDEGIITLTAPLTSQDTVALVAESLSERNAVGGLSGVVDHEGARITAVATVREPAELSATAAQRAAVVTAEER